jgi:hypothetical protein
MGVLACERTEPTGLPPARAGAPSGEQAASVYPEERPFWNLSQTVPGSAGFFIDTASGNVVVSLTDLRQAEAAKGALRSDLAQELAHARASHPHADVVSRRVAYTFLQLKAWRDRLNSEVFTIPGVVWLDLDELKNRVVVGLRRGVPPDAARSLARDLGVPYAAIDFEVDGPLVFEAGLTDQIRPIAGGTKIETLVAGSAVDCSLGFPALWKGMRAFVTASHCSRTTFAVDSTKQYQPTAPVTHTDSVTLTAIGFEVADYSEACPPKVGTACAWADAAVYQFTGAASQWVLGRVARPTYGCFPGPCSPLNLQIGGYFAIAGTDSSILVGDLVNMIGMATGWNQAYVQKSCVNVKLATGLVAECQDFANYGNGAGDSGAPVLLNVPALPNTTVVLGGIHSGQTGQYAVFSPWSGVARDYPGLVVKALPPVPALPPDSIPATLYADSNLVVNSTRLSGVFVRDVVDLLFVPGTPQSQRQAAVDQIQGQVIGGSPYPDGDGYYLVKVPGDGTDGPVFAAIAQLKALPQVSVAIVEVILEHATGYLRPNDGLGWQRANWSVDPNLASGVNWSLEAVAAPLAWGCDTGSSTTPIAVVDNAFVSGLNDLQPNIQQAFRSDAFPQLPKHGVAVASTLAAVGNNGIGITGMMWRAGLRLYEVGEFTAQGTPIVRNGEAVFGGRAVANRVVRAAVQGARVVNLSLYRRWPNSVPGTKADSDVIAQIVAPMVEALRNRMPPRGAPLLVVIAGNNGQFFHQLSAFWSGFPALADTFPNTVVVVGASDAAGAYASSADTGRLVSVAAPGVGVEALGGTGADTVVSGTSIAAPLASGLGGLLLSFDSTLTTSDLRRLIIMGARQGGRVAGTVPILNAYESLRAAAQRPGAPLCGNRVWANGTNIYAQRDTTSSTGELLFNSGDTASYVNVFHGGHRIEVFDRGFNTHAFRYVSPGTWQATTDTAVTLPGGTYSSLLWYSHNRDSVVDITQGSGSGVATLDVGFRTGTAPRLSLGTITVPLATTDTMCVRLSQGTTPLCEYAVPNGTVESMGWATAFGMTGGQIFVTVSKFLRTIQSIGGWSPCPWDPTPLPPNPETCRTVSWLTTSEATALWSVPVPKTSSGPRSPWSFTSPKQVFWLAGSEDGKQIVTGEGQSQQTSRLIWTVGAGAQLVADPPTFTGCGVGYRRTTNGADPTLLVATYTPCVESQGQGTVAPAPPVSGP